MNGANYHQPFALPPNRVWRSYTGGLLLDRIEGRESPADGHFPEDWVGSATRAVNPGREDVEDEGIGTARGADGQSIRMDAFYGDVPEAALGAEHVAAYGAQPQLLVKLLDSAVRLQMQAHPSVPWARRHLGASSGKTEAWYILDSRPPDPWVLLGFQRPPQPQEWKRLMERQDVDGMLGCFDRIPVAPSDVLLVEGGIPHAIGPGLLMVEVQEPTDYVVRCEWGEGKAELPESARTMGLGVDRVLDLFRYERVPADRVRERFGPRKRTVTDTGAGTEQALLSAPQTDRLEVRRVRATGGEPFTLSMDGRMSILIVLDGRGRVVGDGVPLEVGPWSRVLLPAALESVTLEGAMEGVRCMPPKPHATNESRGSA